MLFSGEEFTKVSVRRAYRHSDYFAIQVARDSNYNNAIVEGNKDMRVKVWTEMRHIISTIQLWEPPGSLPGTDSVFWAEML